MKVEFKNKHLLFKVCVCVCVQKSKVTVNIS